jgi:hypothetical protein
MMMKYGSNTRRSRSRSNGKRHMQSRTQNFESNGPDVKVRGTAQQVLEKYLALARDATSAGDRIAAEGFFQHAEHYYRILNVDSGSSNGQGRAGRHGRDGYRDGGLRTEAGGEGMSSVQPSDPEGELGGSDFDPDSGPAPQ